MGYIAFLTCAPVFLDSGSLLELEAPNIVTDLTDSQIFTFAVDTQN